jgi:hypothetical protein
MATYTLISSNVLTSTTSFVEFTGIPATYTDLVLKYSSRTVGTGNTYSNQNMQFNSSGGTAYSNTRLFTDGGTPVSDRRVDDDKMYDWLINSNSSTSNTFSSTEIYIPSYTVSQSKPISLVSVLEGNTTSVGDIFIFTQAHLWRNNAAITSLKVQGGASFASGSSFYLYGISNA